MPDALAGEINARCLGCPAVLGFGLAAPPTSQWGVIGTAWAEGVQWQAADGLPSFFLGAEMQMLSSGEMPGSATLPQPPSWRFAY